MKVARDAPGKELPYKVRWVYFPLLIETCGTMRERKVNSTRWDEWVCVGEVRETENRCVVGAWTVDGEAVVGWAQSMSSRIGTKREREMVGVG